MKLIEVVTAYQALLKLKQVPFQYSVLIKLSKTINKLKENAEFFAEEEQKLVKEYSDKDADGNADVKDGKFTITDNAKRQDFILKKLELCNIEVEITADKINLPLSSVDAGLTLADLEAIEQFVEVE